MGQYIVDILAVILAAVIIIFCARKGLFLTVLSFFKFLLSVLAAYFFGSKLGVLLGKVFINDAVYNSISGKFNEIYQSLDGAAAVESFKQAIPKFLQTDDMMAKLNGLEGAGEEWVNEMASTVSDALSAVICTVVGSILMFLAAMLLLTLVYFIIKKIRSTFKLLGIADSVLGAILGCLISCIVLMLFGSIVKLFFGTTDVYQASKLVKFFGDATLTDFFGWLNVDKWIDKING